MRMPGFLPEVPQHTTVSEYPGGGGSANPSGVFPQASCSLGKWFECLGKARACVPICLSGNIPGCIACLATGAPDCVPCLAG
jgi:hypothetical protein